MRNLESLECCITKKICEESTFPLENAAFIQRSEREILVEIGSWRDRNLKIWTTNYHLEVDNLGQIFK